MKIEKFEQSGFILELESGFRLAIDIGKYTPLEKLDLVRVDAMLISHIHGDHFSLDQIKKLLPKKLYVNRECRETLGEEALPFEIVEINVGDTIDIDAFRIELFNVDHGPNVSAPVLENFGFLIEADKKKIYFAGDMFYDSGIDVGALSVDCAMLPIGGFYTFGPLEALEFAKKFKSIKQIIPMHYDKTPETNIEFQDMVGDRFVVKNLQ